MKKEEKIAILQDVIRIRSVNGNEAEVAAYLSNVLKKYGIDSEQLEYSVGRNNLIAEIGNTSQGKVLAFSGHMDVVDPGNEKDWKYPPFAAEIEGNNLYGRGASDMKSGLVAMLIAMIELKEEQAPLHGKIKLLATVGEEIGELGAEQLTKKGYVEDVDAMIIGEPTNYYLMYAHMGSINYTVVSYGKEAHSSMPQLGYNAINHLNRFMTKINDKMEEISLKYTNTTLGKTIHNVTVIDGGNQVNSIPNLAKLQGNIRSIPEFDNTKIIELLQSVVDDLNQGEDYHLELKIDFNKIPVEMDKDSSLIQCVQKQFDPKLPLVSASGTTDAAEFTKGDHSFDLVVFGPGVSVTAHQVNEYVELDNYLDMIDKYKAIAKDYLQ